MEEENLVEILDKSFWKLNDKEIKKFVEGKISFKNRKCPNCIYEDNKCYCAQPKCNKRLSIIIERTKKGNYNSKFSEILIAGLGTSFLGYALMQFNYFSIVLSSLFYIAVLFGEKRRRQFAKVLYFAREEYKKRTNSDWTL